MARKSNKTTHVLNLIAGSNPNVEEEKESVDQSTSNEKKTSVNTNESIINVLTHEYDPLSDSIKDALEKEEANQRKKQKIVDVDLNEPQSIKGLNSEPAIENTVAAEIALKDMSTIPPSNQGSTYEKNTLARRLRESQKLHFHDRKDINFMLDLDFKYINVYERIIEEKILDYMKKFNMCMCDRCIVDTFALALSHLPTKIVVTDRDSVFPMISFYETKNTAIISTELIKACLLVKEKPNHE